MMISSHCPEPWCVVPSDEHEGRFDIDHSGSGGVAGCDGLFQHDAERIVACVNACKGIDTKDLGSCCVLMAAAPELLAALRKLMQYSDNYQGEACCDSDLGAYLKAQAAIAKAVGG